MGYDSGTISMCNTDQKNGRLDDQRKRDRLSRALRPEVEPVLLAATQQYLRALRDDETPEPTATEAWHRFYARYHLLVRSMVVACHVYGPDADDCVQDAWIELCRALITFQYRPTRGRFQSWLQQIVRRTAFRWHREQQQFAAGRDPRDLGNVCDRAPGPQAACLNREFRRNVRDQLAAFRHRLSPTTYRVFYLATVKGCSVSEISERLGLSRDKVYARHSRAKRLFRRFFEQNPVQGVS